MNVPFPGMDPYLELPSRWPDVHSSLMYAIREQLQRQIGPRYKAVITPYTTIERIAVTPNRRSIMPDIGVIEQRSIPQSIGALAIAPAPMQIAALMEVPTRYSQVAIRTLEDETLVTAIEVLSPSNKRVGVEGNEAYEKKRQDIFRSATHLLEIDLLRAGVRPRMSEPLPATPYAILLSRAETRPYIDVWPVALETAIPVVPVPLQSGDPDVPLDLNAALRQIYASAQYDQQIDYTQPPPAPDLTSAEQAWLDSHLRALGLRG